MSESSCSDSFAGDFPLELGEGQKHIQGQPSHAGGCVDPVEGSARHVDDVSSVILPIAKRATKRRDVHPNVGLFDERVRPYNASKFFLLYNFASPFGQDLQNGQSATSQAQRTIAFEQQPLSGKQPEGPETYNFVMHMG
jgi:hypothetical protein